MLISELPNKLQAAEDKSAGRTINGTTEKKVCFVGKQTGREKSGYGYDVFIHRAMRHLYSDHVFVVPMCLLLRITQDSKKCVT